MKLRKTVAFLIALSMLAGLVCLVPSSALTPVTGYVEEVLVDEHFSGNYDKTYLTVFNGTIADGALNFTLNGESYMALSAEIDTSVNRQYVMDFHLSTTAEYTDPYTATFIGLRTAQTDIAPYNDVNGAWVGITQDKLILWYSYKNNFWDKASAKEDVHYALIDAPVSLADADYRVIYDGSTVELSYMEDDAATTLVTLTFNTSTKYVTMASGDVSLTSPIAFAEAQNVHYFTLYNYKKAQTVEEDPLAPRDDWEDTEGGEEEAGEAAAIALDDFVLTAYTKLLVTDAQKTTLQGLLDDYQAILDAYGTEEAVYADNGVDTAALQGAVNEIADTLADETLTSDDAANLIETYQLVTSDFVTKEVEEAYPSRYDTFSQLIADVKEQVALGEADYSLAGLEKIEEQIASARALVDADSIRLSRLESAYTAVARAISNMNIYLEDGIPLYEQSFTAGLTYEAFAKDWTQQGSGYAAVPVTTIYGAPVNLWGAVAGYSVGSNYRYQMIFNNAYDTYAVKATLTKRSGGYASMVLRTGTGINIHEDDRQSPAIIAAYGTGSIVIASLGTTTGLETLLIAVEDGKFVRNTSPGKRVATSIDMVSLGLLTDGNKTCTVLAKDFGELVEIYALSPEDESKVKLATIVFTGEDAGTLTNEISGEVQSFTEMAMNKPSAGHVGFGSRSGTLYVKDFQISNNILPETEILMNTDGSDPTDFTLLLENDHPAVGEAAHISTQAAFDSLKIIGKNEYKAGTIDVSGESGFYTTNGDGIIAVDTEAYTITGVVRGSEILTAAYVGENVAYVDKALVTVESEAYEAPAEEDVFEGRIVEAAIANSQVFKSLDEGLSAIPVISYTYPNGSSALLPADRYVAYFSTNEDVIAYNNTTGRYEAKAPGTAKIYAVVYDSVGETTTPYVNVEVTEAGTMDLGASYTVAAQDLIELAKSDDVTTEAMWETAVDAIIAGMDITISDETDVALLIGALAELPDDASTTDIADACALITEVRKVYDIVQSKENSGDDLADYLFDKDLNCEQFDIDKAEYNKLSKSKQSQLTTRMFAQLAKQGTEITPDSIKETFETIYESVANAGSGGGGKGTVTSKTNSGLGNTTFVPAAGTTTATQQPVKPAPTAEEVAAASARFSDIEDAPWAKEIIGSLAARGIVDGYEDATIRPNGTITRDEFVKLVIEALSIDTTTTGPAVYNDIPAGSWQEKYVAAATREGIAEGIDTLVFGAGQVISRQDMALIIYRAIVKNNITLPAAQSVAFRDEEFIADYAKDAINRLAAAGVVAGMGDGTFAPQAGASRAQAFAMIYALVNLAN